MTATFSVERRTLAATLLVLAALIVPWMSPVHPAPLADWLTDALTLGFIGLAALVPLSLTQEKTLTRATLLGWGMVTLIAALNFIHKPAYLVQSWLPAGALLAMVLLAAVVRNLTQTPEARSRFLDALAVALLFGAMLQALIGFAQYTGIANYAGMWLVHTPGAHTSTVMGNISQRNVFAHVLALGVVSACWLHARGHLRLRWMTPMVAFIAIIQAWSGARLVLVYGAGLIVLAGWWWLRARHDETVRRFCRAAWVSGVLMLGMQWVAVWVAKGLWVGFGIGGSPESGLNRFFSEDSMGSNARRLSEWSKALDAFSHHPIFGVGWGGFAHSSAYTEAFGTFIKAPDDTLCLHAHNLVVQLLVETGLVGTLIALGGILWCLWPSLRRATADSVFLLALAMVTLAHSQLEYPLWYITGLATFTVVLACASPEPVGASAVRPILRRFAAVLTGALLVIYGVAGWSSFKAISTAFGTLPNQWSKTLGDKIYNLQKHPLWAFESELVIAIHLIPNGEPLQAKRALLEHQASYRPYGPILFKLAILRAIQGEMPKAMEATEMMIAGFPGLLRPFLAYADQIPEPEIEPIKKRMIEAMLARGIVVETAESTASATSSQ